MWNSSNRKFKTFISFALLLCPGFGLHMGAQTDSLHLSIEGTVLVSSRNTSVIRKSSAGVMNVDMDLMQNLPQILGNTDPLRFVRLLPGVQTNSECDAGIHIQGCDNAHNQISCAGIPIYGANHLLGLFSVFNPSHYGGMTFSNTSSLNRLGGMVDMVLPDTLKRTFSGNVSVGIMSSQGTLGVRIGRRSHLKVSARGSYLDLLYKRWLKLNESQLEYGFSDYNLTYLLVPGRKDRLWADFYYGQDHAGLDEISYNLDLDAGWSNLMGALHWHHDGDEIRHRHSLFYSGYDSRINVLQDDTSADLPSFIMSGGYKGALDWSGFTAGAEVTAYRVRLQHPEIGGLFGRPDEDVAEIQNALETSVSLGYERTFLNALDVSAGLRGSLYLSPESRLYHGLCPELSVSYDMSRSGVLRAAYGWKKQHIFQTGLSNVGFPLEFWVLSGKYADPQKCQYAEASYEVDLFNDMLGLSVGAYWKKLYDQTEYKGDILDLLMSEYDLHEKLLKGKGWNYGLTFMLHKQAGKFTGWMNYSLGRSLRMFDNPLYQGVFPSNHERIHDLHLMGSYRMGHWNFSGTFVYASGLPFTAPEYFHLASGQLIIDYGEHNAFRMRPYMRLDLAVSYYFNRDSERENGINLSVYNVLCRSNELLYRLFVYDDGYRFGPVSMPFNLMPSISYFHKF